MRKTTRMFITVMLLVLCCMTLALAEDYKLPDTGIEKCYDNNVEIPCPEQGQPFYGQDARYHGNKMAYQDNGDGTVTDLNTRLMWQQSDDGVQREWQAACDYCSNLVFAGYSDWRIPTRRELFSIVDLGRYDPAINTDYFINVKSARYWSGSSSLVTLTVRGTCISAMAASMRTVRPSNSYVRCVRSGPY